MFTLLISFLVLIYSVILHEIAHGFVADRLGDPTARLSGRLTLDPRPHIDPLMTVALPLLLLLTGSHIIFGAARPVPIDPFNFREPKKDTAIVALAGPLTNLALALVAGLVLRLGGLFILDEGAYSVFAGICLTTARLNAILAVFNLFPLPPLDGFKVLMGVVSDRIAGQLAGLERFGFILIFMVLIFFPELIFGIIYPVVETINKIFLP